MSRKQVYMIVVFLGMLVVFLIGLYWSSSRSINSKSISLEESPIGSDFNAANASKSPLTPIVITTTTPIDVGDGNLLPTSVNTVEVLSVQNYDDHLSIVLGYLLEDKTDRSISVNVFDNVNYFDAENKQIQVAPTDLFQYISVGERLSLDFFSNSDSKPVTDEQLATFFIESGLNALNSSQPLSPVETSKLASLFQTGGGIIDHAEFRIITIRKVDW